MYRNCARAAAGLRQRRSTARIHVVLLFILCRKLHAIVELMERKIEIVLQITNNKLFWFEMFMSLFVCIVK